MVVNIYYGGRGLIEDPTIYVINKLKDTLEEIRVTVNLYNLYEHEVNSIPTLVNTLKNADGVILAVNVEWMGIGGFMQHFLDSCWLYADKEKISSQYMMPVVISSTYGEEEALIYLRKAWHILGGRTWQGICAYVYNQADFETSKLYSTMIEESAEQFYRAINQSKELFPSSTLLVKNKTLNPNNEITGLGNEELTKQIFDETYVKKQKEDIEELTAFFKDILDKKEENEQDYDYVSKIKENFHPIPDFKASYAIQVMDINKTIIIEIDGTNIECYYDDKVDVDVYAKISQEGMDKLVEGRTSFNAAFMSGTLTAKGNFNFIRTFDQLFIF